ncbi:DNA-directed RNA polymerase subunit H [Candidatus Woesearchaeota archaeon]|nr:MAG: DNA-directed RNA polymerase subunit H [Candidatus Woesearchaeota archaeon]
MTKANKHRLVPEHIKLTEEEKKKVLEEYNIQVNQLPIIFASDPAIKDLGAAPGDVIKIIRKSKTAGESVFYRGVANG